MQAAGDSSTWTSRNEAWPADDAYVVSVGGTDLITASAAGPGSRRPPGPTAAAAFRRTKLPFPRGRQLAGVINSSNKGSTTYRNGPDVSANANFTFYVCADQTTCTANEYGGTSFAAPMWAGYMALANQQAAANGAATSASLTRPFMPSAGVELRHRLPRHHQRQQRLLGRDRLRSGHRLGQPQRRRPDERAGRRAATAGFTVSASPTSVSVVKGSTGSTTVTSTVSGGFSSAVTLAASGLTTLAALQVRLQAIASWLKPSQAADHQPPWCSSRVTTQDMTADK